MDFLRELIKLNEGHNPDFDKMSNHDLAAYCKDAGVGDICKFNAKHRLLNRTKVIHELVSGNVLDADVKQHEAGQSRSDETTYVNIQKDVLNLYNKPVIQESAPVNIQKDVLNLYNKPVIKEKAPSKSKSKSIVTDEIGNKGMKGMKKKDRPYMKQPRLRYWLTGNMFFNMTKSGKLAGNMDKE